MIILGIDPGIGRTGWGLVSYEHGKSKVIEYGCFETSSRGPLPYRLTSLKREIVRIIERHKPERCGIESLFFSANTKTAMDVGQARGVIVETLAEHEIPIESFTPLQVKLAITGYGKAEKAQMGVMIKMLLGLAEVPKPDDTADALAVALTCAFSNKFNQITSD